MIESVGKTAKFRVMLVTFVLQTEAIINSMEASSFSSTGIEV